MKTPSVIHDNFTSKREQNEKIFWLIFYTNDTLYLYLQKNASIYMHFIFTLINTLFNKTVGTCFMFVNIFRYPVMCSTMN